MSNTSGIPEQHGNESAIKRDEPKYKPFMLRLSAEDRARFIAAANADGYRQLAAWLRWLGTSRANAVLGEAKSKEAGSAT